MEGIKGKTIEEIAPSNESAEVTRKTVQEALKTGTIQILEYEFPNPVGKGYYEGRVAPVEKKVGDKKVVVWLAREITHQRANLEELKRYQENLESCVEERSTEILQTNADLMREKESRIATERMLVERQDYLNKIIDSILAMVYVRSTDSVFIMVSRKYTEFFGFSDNNELLSRMPDWVFQPDIAEIMLENDRRVVESGTMSELEYWYDISGERRYLLERAIPLMDDHGHIISIVGTVVDLTEAKKREDYITHLALHDALTGLANRMCVLDKLANAIKNRQEDQSVAILFIDLDFFKAINDTIGHEAGDVVLKETAKRFCTCVRKGDTVGRFGGDEFVIVLEGVRSRDDIEEVIANIFAIVGQPIPFEEHKCVVGASVGISICPEHAGSVDSLLTCSDDAMYAVKKKGKNSYTYYQPPESPKE
jgi:diguanylate cyclase (GGDEF)-like protein/PAS domain S-box-containing protein